MFSLSGGSARDGVLAPLAERKPRADCSAAEFLSRRQANPPQRNVFLHCLAGPRRGSTFSFAASAPLTTAGALRFLLREARSEEDGASPAAPVPLNQLLLLHRRITLPVSFGNARSAIPASTEAQLQPKASSARGSLEEKASPSPPCRRLCFFELRSERSTLIAVSQTRPRSLRKGAKGEADETAPFAHQQRLLLGSAAPLVLEMESQSDEDLTNDESSGRDLLQDFLSLYDLEKLAEPLRQRLRLLGCFCKRRFLQEQREGDFEQEQRSLFEGGASLPSQRRTFSNEAEEARLPGPQDFSCRSTPQAAEGGSSDLGAALKEGGTRPRLAEGPCAWCEAHPLEALQAAGVRRLLSPPEAQSPSDRSSRGGADGLQRTPDADLSGEEWIRWIAACEDLPRFLPSSRTRRRLCVKDGVSGKVLRRVSWRGLRILPGVSTSSENPSQEQPHPEGGGGEEGLEGFAGKLTASSAQGSPWRRGDPEPLSPATSPFSSTVDNNGASLKGEPLSQTRSQQARTLKEASAFHSASNSTLLHPNDPPSGETRNDGADASSLSVFSSSAPSLPPPPSGGGLRSSARAVVPLTRLGSSALRTHRASLRVGGRSLKEGTVVVDETEFEASRVLPPPPSTQVGGVGFVEAGGEATPPRRPLGKYANSHLTEQIESPAEGPSAEQQSAQQSEEERREQKKQPLLRSSPPEAPLQSAVKTQGEEEGLLPPPPCVGESQQQQTLESAPSSEVLRLTDAAFCDTPFLQQPPQKAYDQNSVSPPHSRRRPLSPPYFQLSVQQRKLLHMTEGGSQRFSKNLCSASETDSPTAAAGAGGGGSSMLLGRSSLRNRSSPAALFFRPSVAEDEDTTAAVVSAVFERETQLETPLGHENCFLSHAAAPSPAFKERGKDTPQRAEEWQRRGSEEDEAAPDEAKHNLEIPDSNIHPSLSVKLRESDHHHHHHHPLTDQSVEFQFAPPGFRGPESLSVQLDAAAASPSEKSCEKADCLSPFFLADAESSCQGAEFEAASPKRGVKEQSSFCPFLHPPTPACPRLKTRCLPTPTAPAPSDGPSWEAKATSTPQLCSSRFDAFLSDASADLSAAEAQARRFFEKEESSPGGGESGGANLGFFAERRGPPSLMQEGRTWALRGIAALRKKLSLAPESSSSSSSEESSQDGSGSDASWSDEEGALQSGVCSYRRRIPRLVAEEASQQRRVLRFRALSSQEAVADTLHLPGVFPPVSISYRGGLFYTRLIDPLHELLQSFQSGKLPSPPRDAMRPAASALWKAARELCNSQIDEALSLSESPHNVALLEVGSAGPPQELFAGERLLLVGASSDNATKAQSERWEVRRFAVGVGRHQGLRASMEDEDVALQDLPLDSAEALCGGGKAEEASFFAVYDGHGGNGCAQFTKACLHRLLQRQLWLRCGGLGNSRRIFRDLYVATRRAFLATDGLFLLGAPPHQQLSGCAAVVVLVLQQRGLLLCANCGDARAVLSRGGLAVNLSLDHRPDRADELIRIVAAGGHVRSRRVLGKLAVSRALGDRQYKRDWRQPEAEAAAARRGGGVSSGRRPRSLVIAEPEIRLLGLAPQDEFLLVACDGLFDVFSSQEAVDFVRARLSTSAPCRGGGRGSLSFGDAAGQGGRSKVPIGFHRLVENGRLPSQSDLDDVVAALVHEAIHERRSGDNVSAVLVDLRVAAQCTDTPNSANGAA